MPESTAYPCGFFPGMFPQGTIKVNISNNTDYTLNQNNLTYFTEEM